MKKLLALLSLWIVGTIGYAQSIYVYPATVTAVAGGDQTCTAIVNGVNDKTVAWSTTGGTLVGINPSTANEPATIALHATAGTYTVTATSNVGAITGTCVMTITAAPTPLTTHPRFLFTQSNLAAMQAKAAASTPGDNSPYQAVRSQAIAYYNQLNSAPISWSWHTGSTCSAGGTGQPAITTQYLQYQAYFFAIMYLLDPSDGTYNWQCYAHDVGIYFMTLDTSGGGEPGADAFSDQSVNAALVSDWMLSSPGGGFNAPVTSSPDIAQIHAYLEWLAVRVLTWTGAPNLGATGTTPIDSTQYNTIVATTSQGPQGTSATSSPFSLGAQRSGSGNNYNESRLLLLAAIGYTFNDTTMDDPALTNTCSATRYQVCPDFTAGSLHAYARYWDGVLLYNYWAHIEDPNVAWQAYQAAYANLPTQPMCESTDLQNYPCYGDGRGGESSEGSWYQYSMYRARYAFNILHTAGLDDPAVLGPQISASTSSWWDMKYITDLEFLTGNTVQATYTYPNYTYLTTGDSYRYKKDVFDAWTEAAMLAFDSYTGRTDRAPALKWLNYNFAPGGPLGTSWGCTGPWCGYDAVLPNYNYSDGSAVDMFIALPAGDPTSSLPSDPRPSLPTDLYNASFNQHLMVRNNWTSPTLFTYYFPNSQINHEYQIDGAFDIFSANEYITKHRTIFNNYNIYMTAANQIGVLNILNSVGNTCNGTPFTAGCSNWQLFNTGGETLQGTQAGLTPVLHSELPAYVAVTADTTNSYNGAAYGDFNYGAYNDITAASRDMLYLRGSNQVMLYDREAVGHAASTSYLTQISTGVPSISGNTANWLTPSTSQQAYFTTLLPAGGSLAVAKLPVWTTTGAPHGNLQNGTTMQMTCTYTFADTTTGACGAQNVFWFSDTPSIATVSSTGLVTAMSTGTATIYVSGEGMESWGTVTVISGTSSGSWTNIEPGTFDYQLEDPDPISSLSVTPAGSPTSSQYLSLLQWGAAGFSEATPALVQSIAGQGYDCAQTTITLGCFMRTLASFTGTEVTVPGGVTTTYFSDLTPNTSYTVAGTGCAGTVTSDTAGVLSLAGCVGNVTVGTATPTAATPTYSPVAGTYTGTQSVTLSTSTGGASICWTNDGSTPLAATPGTCSHGTTYSGAVSVASSLTLKAIATESGFINSSVGSAAYVINTPSGGVTISGTVTISGSVTIQ